MELPRDYLIQPVAMLRNAGREPAGLPVVIKSEQRSQSRRNAGRNRPEYARSTSISFFSQAIQAPLVASTSPALRIMKVLHHCVSFENPTECAGVMFSK
jgi:hypothetical protein